MNARKPEDIVADFVRVTGGEKRWRAHRNMYRRNDIVFPENGINGSEEQWTTSSDMSFTTTSLPGAGSPREGCDASACWSEDPINGLRILTGDESTQARLASAWNPELRLHELFASVRSRVEHGADGTDYECLELTPRSGPAVVNCYDPRTHLLANARSVRATPQGELPFRTVFDDWRDVDGIKLPFVTRTTTGPITFESRTVDVRFDVQVSNRVFAPPVPGKKQARPNAL